MKKVAMVVYSHYPADPRVRREAEALEKKNVRVDIFCLRGEKEKKVEDFGGIRVYRLPVAQSRTSKMRYIVEYALFFFLVCFKIFFIGLIRQYDFVHVHNMPDFLVFTALLPKIFGAKVFLDLHDPMPEVYMSKYDMPYHNPIIRHIIFQERQSIRFAHKIITPNSAFKKRFAERGCPEEKIHIVMNSPQTDIFGERLGRDSIIGFTRGETIEIMYHGTLAERNGMLTAIDAMVYLHERNIPFQFHVYGNGDPKFIRQFTDKISETGMSEMIHFHGYKPMEEISRLISRAHIGIIPNNRSPFTEINLPTRILEYLCKGIPTVAPSTRGIKDYFNSDNLFLFEPGDPGDLADTIQFIIENPEEARAKTERGIEIYKKYRWIGQAEYLTKTVYGLEEH